jgi:hypothetical protein
MPTSDDCRMIVFEIKGKQKGGGKKKIMLSMAEIRCQLLSIIYRIPLYLVLNCATQYHLKRNQNKVFPNT